MEEMYQWLDWNLHYFGTTRRGFGAFPEGSRNCAPEPRKLKKGLVGYLFYRKMKVQVYAVFGLENTFNEYDVDVFPGKHTVEYILGKVVDPDGYDTFEEFYDAVSEAFEENF
jgi:1-acyl-sn-glycerol-3-phosphate acyltransferase